MKTLNQSIISIRVSLQNAKLKKSGKNKFAGFDYFELADFLPKLNELMEAEDINDRYYITNEYAVLELIKGEEVNTYTIPFVMFETPANIKVDKDTGEAREIKTMQDIQYLGALNTYYKRYLYLNAFGITDGEVIDSMDNGNLVKPDKDDKDKPEPKATEKQIELINKLYKPEEMQTIYDWAKISNLNDLTVSQASKLIAKRKDNK
jgi:hypothetical protein